MNGLPVPWFFDPVNEDETNLRTIDLRMGEERGRNDDAVVVEATYNLFPLAVKKILRVKYNSPSNPNLEAFNREIELLRESRSWECDNIVKVYGWHYNVTNARYAEAFLILELMDFDLKQIIQGDGFRARLNDLSDADMSCLGYMMLRDICNGLRTAHGLNPGQTVFMHRDIKASNIMVSTQDRRLALIDFGTTKIIGQGSSIIHSTNVGHCSYRAPECIDSNHYDESCDIWSVGITMIYFLTGAHPITDNMPEQSDESSSSASRIVDERIRDHDWNIELPAEDFEDGLVEIINRCVSREPRDRPTADKIYREAVKQLKRFDDDAPSIFDEMFTVQ